MKKLLYRIKRDIINYSKFGITKNQPINQFQTIENELIRLKSLVIDLSLAYQRNYEFNKLNKEEFKAFSQNGEDGILSSILRKLEISFGYFVEFGVQDGLETNTTLLLFKGWKGLWMEADKSFYQQIQTNLKPAIEQQHLDVLNLFVDKDNFESILFSKNVPFDFDILSIDIDSNDYWIWESLTNFKPKIVVIEYNAFFPPDIEWVMDYNESGGWDGSTIYFGASIKSLFLLGEKKGYTLVCCSLAGVNAFFVRNDLLSDKFDILDISQIYKPINYHLKRQLPIKNKIGNL